MIMCLICQAQKFLGASLISPDRLAASSAKEEATLTSGPRMSTMRMAGTSPVEAMFAGGYSYLS